jgi:hypothetical protein
MAESETGNPLGMRCGQMDRGVGAVFVAGDDAAPPTAVVDLLQAALADRAQRGIRRRGLAAGPGSVEGRDVRPILEQRLDPPLDLGNGRDEQDARSSDGRSLRRRRCQTVSV